MYDVQTVLFCLVRSLKDRSIDAIRYDTFVVVCLFCLLCFYFYFLCFLSDTFKCSVISRLCMCFSIKIGQRVFCRIFLCRCVPPQLIFFFLCCRCQAPRFTGEPRPCPWHEEPGFAHLRRGGSALGDGFPSVHRKHSPALAAQQGMHGTNAKSWRKSGYQYKKTRLRLTQIFSFWTFVFEPY